MLTTHCYLAPWSKKEYSYTIPFLGLTALFVMLSSALSSVTIFTTVITYITKLVIKIHGYLLCQSYEIRSINKLSCLAIFFHITFLEDAVTAVYNVIIICTE
jgi:hypothetical protein